jgi:hypothetical protein
MTGAQGFGDRWLPGSCFLGELSIVRESLRCGRSISRVGGRRCTLCFTRRNFGAVPGKVIGFYAGGVQIISASEFRSRPA